RRSLRQSPYPSLPRDPININTNNPDAEQNNGVHLPPVETSSLQPPPYEATDESQNNSSEMNQRYVVSNREARRAMSVDPLGHCFAIELRS
ncbi:8510_t:CDS:2, partial [Paraglomus occultum]